MFRTSISYLYFIQAGDFPHIKIGLSDQVHARLAHLQLQNPFPLYVRDVIRDKPMRIDMYEQILHKRLADRRGFGEWFHISLVELRDTADRMGFVRIEIPDGTLVQDIIAGLDVDEIIGAKFDPLREKPLDAR